MLRALEKFRLLCFQLAKFITDSVFDDTQLIGENIRRKLMGWKFFMTFALISLCSRRIILSAFRFERSQQIYIIVANSRKLLET